jgi:hypothetical protein
MTAPRSPGGGRQQQNGILAHKMLSFLTKIIAIGVQSEFNITARTGASSKREKGEKWQEDECTN